MQGTDLWDLGNYWELTLVSFLFLECILELNGCWNPQSRCQRRKVQRDRSRNVQGPLVYGSQCRGKSCLNKWHGIIPKEHTGLGPDLHLNSQSGKMSDSGGIRKHSRVTKAKLDIKWILLLSHQIKRLERLELLPGNWIISHSKDQKYL